MDILWQGNEHESFSALNNNQYGGFSRDTSMVDGSWRLALSGAQYLEGDAGVNSLTDLAMMCSHFNGDGVSFQPGAAEFMKMMDSSGVGWLRVRMPTTAGTFVIELWDGGAWNSIASGIDPALAAGRWNFHVTGAGGMSGAALLQRNGVTIVSVTGQDFTDFADLRFCRWGCMGTDATRSDTSEFAIGTASLANHKLKTVRANANGTDASDGSGTYTDVNENGLNDATFIELTASGQKRSIKAAARTLSSPAYKGVTVTGRLMVQDLTGPQQAKPYLLISGTRYYGTTFALTTGFVNYQYTWLVNPATTLAWTTSDVNSANLEWGWEAVT